MGNSTTKSNEAWVGDLSSGSDYGIITYFRVTIVPLEHDNWGRVGGYDMDKTTLWYFYSFWSLILVEIGWSLLPLKWGRAKVYFEQIKPCHEKIVLTQGFQ